MSGDSGEIGSDDENSKKLITAEGLNRKASISRHSTTSQRLEEGSEIFDEKENLAWVDKIEPRLKPDWLDEFK